MKISIDFTERDIQELMNGEEFNWTYQTDDGQDAKVHLFNADSVCCRLD